MDPLRLEPQQILSGELEVPGDKSLTHRALIFAALASGESSIENPLDSADTQSTVSALRQLGVEINASKKGLWKVSSPGLHDFSEPKGEIDCGNSGTTSRLLMGILAAQHFPSRIVGDASLSKRPMDRVLQPLQRMGARFESTNGYLPVKISPAPKDGLAPLHYQSPVASAQIKSACLLAALYAPGVSSITEPAMSRDHTERLLRQYMPVSAGNVVEETLNAKKTHRQPYRVEIAGPIKSLAPRTFKIPGDFSSAAFFLVGACMSHKGKIKIKNVGVNPTRTGLWDILLDMKANIRMENEVEIDGEPRADLIAEESELAAVNVYGDIVPRVIDELPIWTVAAAAVKKSGSISVLSDATELRVKETDRLAALADNLKRLGLHIETKSDGLLIRSRGGKVTHPQSGKKGLEYLDSFDDHRIAMAMCMASLIVEGDDALEIRDTDCINISYPSFLKDFKSLLKRSTS